MANVIHSPSSISVQMHWWQIFKHWELYIKTAYFYEVYSLAQPVTEYETGGFLHQSIFVMQKVTLYNDC